MTEAHRSTKGLWVIQVRSEFQPQYCSPIWRFYNLLPNFYKHKGAAL